MSKVIADLQDLKNAFISHCKELGCEENYIKVCENKFDNIETTLKDNEELKNNQGIDRKFAETFNAAIKVVESKDNFDKEVKKLLNENEKLRKSHNKKEVNRKLEAFEIIAGSIPFRIKYDEKNDDWHLYIVITTQDDSYLEPVTWGEGKEQFDLLKGVLE